PLWPIGTGRAGDDTAGFVRVVPAGVGDDGVDEVAADGQHGSQGYVGGRATGSPPGVLSHHQACTGGVAGNCQVNMIISESSRRRSQSRPADRVRTSVSWTQPSQS